MIVNGNIIVNNGSSSIRRNIDQQSSSLNSRHSGWRLLLLIVLRQWSIVLGLIFILPMIVTYFHLHQLLRYERCAIKIYSPYQIHDNHDNQFNSTKTKLTTTTTTTTTTTIMKKENLTTPQLLLLDGLYCKGQNNGYGNKVEYFIPTGKYFGMSSSSAPPSSIVQLITTIMKAPRESYPSSSSSSATTTATATATATLIYQHDYSLLAESVVTTATADYASSSSYNGFRRNPNKSSSSAAAITSITPITTYFWLLLNIGLYILYWNNRIEPSKVALNDKIIRTVYKKKGGFGFGGSSTSTGSDFSRGITGNLAHFEIWHIGMNMMTLLQVGEILENSKSVGTIPLFLWTCSFLGYTTICVIILYSIKDQIIRMRGRNNNSTTIATTRRKTRTKFPNMVGFSGILFCWSTYMTLSLDKNQKICPIPIVTQICFETYEFDFGLGKGFKFNWGPIVQLLMLQFILPRVSFIGHLSGIIIGFLWYWNILPSLELSQPSILFPLIWLLGKYYLYKMGCNNNNDDDDENDNDTERGQGHVLGGQGSNSNSGYVLGSSKNSSIINANSNNNNNNNNNDHPPQQGRLSSSSFLTLRFIRNCFILHLILITWVYTTRNQQQKQQQVSLLRILVLLYYNNSIIISELLMIIILSLLVRATFTSQSLPNVSNNNVNNPFKSIGILGRGYIALCTVIFITDSMTLGGWFATRGLWSSSWTIPLFLLFIIRLILWIVSISTVCYILDCNNEIQDGRRTHSSSDSNFAGIGDIDGDDNDDDDRIWFHIFGSFLINPCRTFGKVLTENRLSSSWPSSTAATAGGLAMTAAATTTSSTSRSGRSSDSISERRAKI